MHDMLMASRSAPRSDWLPPVIFRRRTIGLTARSGEEGWKALHAACYLYRPTDGSFVTYVTKKIFAAVQEAYQKEKLSKTRKSAG